MRTLRIARAFLHIWHAQVKFRQFNYAVEHPVRSLAFSVGGTLVSLNSLVLSAAVWTGYLHH